MDDIKRRKQYVQVILRCDADGKIHPLRIDYDREHKYQIDRVLDICRAACQSVGGVGIRYTVQVHGRLKYLWNEKDKWFVEAIQ